MVLGFRLPLRGLLRGALPSFCDINLLPRVPIFQKTRCRHGISSTFGKYCGPILRFHSETLLGDLQQQDKYILNATNPRDTVILPLVPSGLETR